MRETTTDGRRIEYAPQIPNGTSTTGVFSVVLRDDEYVTWHYDPAHTRITGYTVCKRKYKSLLAC